MAWAVWAARAAWAGAAVACGPVLAAALDDRSAPVRAVASVGLWAAWAIVLCASLVLHPVGLTALRLAAPALLVAVGVAVAVAGAGGGAADISGPSVVIALVVSLACGLAAFLPETALAFVNGPAYPNERRFPLRAPGPLLLGPLPLAWAASVGMPAAGALLLAARQWVAGSVVTSAGVALAFVLVRALHGLSRRWVVFVPAGLVLHDPMTLADPVLFLREEIVAFGPAEAGTAALDLTAKAFGLALELEVASPAPLALVRPGSRTAVMAEASALLFTPTRPGAVLAYSRERATKRR
jgi:hypothetical protein